MQESFTAFKNDNKFVILPLESLIDHVFQKLLTLNFFSHEGLSWERKVI